MSKDRQSVSFSQSLSVDCSYVSSSVHVVSVVLACLGVCHASRLTVTVCDELDSFTTEFPFVLQRGLPTDIIFGSDWCVYRRDVGVHVPLLSSELTVGDGAELFTRSDKISLKNRFHR